MQVPHDTRVLVADGRKFLLLRNEGDAQALDLQVELAEEQDNPATRDQATDAAGRSSSTTGSAMEQTDFHQIEENRFAAEAAAMLKRRALANEFERLIIIAPPKTLGELRRHYHKAVEQRLAGELAKDLTGHAIPDIEAALLVAD